MSETACVHIDGRAVPIAGERNLLELIRKADIDLATFCYHSELSIYGACRLCIVDIEGRGIQGACSTPPEPGLKVRTNTKELRDIRKMTVELLLANHDCNCTTCPKNGHCQLQDLARRFGITEIRFGSVLEKKPLDHSSVSLVRDPNKCVLCGDCVRMCSEVQAVGAIDFAFRGHDATVVPAFNKDLAAGECVNCGQCAAVCPTGALSVKSELDGVWEALADPRKKVVAQIAPAVRVALGEMFDLPAGPAVTGQAVAALKALGFDAVYDTSFSADLTVIEEANEFLRRKTGGEHLPLFTSCCPAWVKFAEQYYPELLPNLSTCRSPQGMLSSLAKETLPKEFGVGREDLVVVSIMPCTAKKFEARRPELGKDGIQDTDFVLSTQELARMIDEAGLKLSKLSPESFDLPMGFKTGAGVIFGNSGGVTEAVLRYAAEKLTGEKLKSVDFHQVRGEDGVRKATVSVGGHRLKLAIVHGLKNAKALADRIRLGASDYDLVEVRACPGGCIGGAGQPVARDPAEARRARTKALYAADKDLGLHKSQENCYVARIYDEHLGEIGGHKAHELLHTEYQSRRRIEDELDLGTARAADPLKVTVCVGTSCFVKGSQAILKRLLAEVENRGLDHAVDVRASFCFEACDRGPSVQIGGKRLEHCTAEQALATFEEALVKLGVPGEATGPAGGCTSCAGCSCGGELPKA